MTSAERVLRSAGFRGTVQERAPLAPLTTWRIGGPAELLLTPIDVEDLATALSWATETGHPRRVLGNGSNLLVRDEGVAGVVLRLRRVLDRARQEGRRWHVGAGLSFPKLARLAAGAGGSGLEFAAGIPGTVGGAIVMNAGWHEYEIGNHVESVECLDLLGHRHSLTADDCAFGYRTSRFRGGEEIVVGATLRLEEGDAETITRRMEDFAESRKQNQPTELASCGSVFLKPPGDFAGRLIDEAGLKGLRVGGLEVSPKHANFFVNLGGGTARDVLELVERVERAVRERCGVKLQREFVVW